MDTEQLVYRTQRSSQAPDVPGVKDCCKIEGALEVETEDGERFVGTCRTCGCKHRRAFPDLSKLVQCSS
jgi:hypothetical protein